MELPARRFGRNAVRHRPFVRFPRREGAPVVSCRFVLFKVAGLRERSSQSAGGEVITCERRPHRTRQNKLTSTHVRQRTCTSLISWYQRFRRAG